MSEQKSFDIVLTGVGGQGIVMLSNALGNACANADIRVLTGELHGLSQRSGTVYIHLRMGGESISPLIPYGEADAILAMEPMESLRYIEFLKDEGIIILNKRVINPPLEIAELSKEKRTDFVTFENIVEKLKVVTPNIAPIDALALAMEAGNPRTENAVFIGAMSALANLPPSVEDMKIGLETVVPKKALEQNIKAFELGYKTAYDGLCDLVQCREL
ncbi:MAG: indolepyruvate oxidoreductase subunit beta [Thermoplasmata archaeon]|nr:MAG: indolepyruvate oxidoreductase subunit beta [Thermoplasmata archaeon]